MDIRPNITVNAGGLPYISNTNVTVGTESVDIALGFRRIQPVGLLLVRMENAIPTGTSGTLTITLTLNGVTRSLTNMDGSAVTAADITSSGVLLIFNDKFNGILQLMSIPG
jgi:hypothetical protein